MRITVRYKKHRLSALIDAGSDITIVGADFAKSIGGRLILAN